ncbi:class II aldolase/adducin family protein [Phycisphaeraceae bacterium D3-23]
MQHTSLWQLKKEMCEYGKRIWQRGYCAGNEGNHSVRVPGCRPGQERFLCTPTGISKGFLDPGDICVVDSAGKQVERNAKGRKRSSEVLVHLAIYKKRPDINAVIHSHPPHAVAFCLAGIEVPHSIHPEAEVFLGKIVHADYATPGTQALPDSFINKLNQESNTVLMGNHGSVSFADTLEIAYYRLEILDNYCKQLLLARSLGQVKVLDPGQMSELLEVKERFGFPDERKACALEGCVGTEDQPFLANFGMNTPSAQCACDGGPVSCGCDTSGGGGAKPQAAAGGDYEKLVQAITDQIMAGLNQ